MSCWRLRHELLRQALRWRSQIFPQAIHLLSLNRAVGYAVHRIELSGAVFPRRGPLPQFHASAVMQARMDAINAPESPPKALRTQLKNGLRMLRSIGRGRSL